MSKVSVHTGVVCLHSSLFVLGVHSSLFVLGVHSSLFVLGVHSSLFVLGVHPSLFVLGVHSSLFVFGVHSSLVVSECSSFTLCLWCCILHFSVSSPFFSNFSFLLVPFHTLTHYSSLLLTISTLIAILVDIVFSDVRCLLPICVHALRGSLAQWEEGEFKFSFIILPSYIFSTTSSA